MRRIAVILGGRSSENAISLASAASVVDALERSGNEVIAIEIDRNGRWQLETLESGSADTESGSGLARLPSREVAATLTDVDVVFPVLHGPVGEDGTGEGLLGLRIGPYLGSAGPRRG